ncbi:MAG: acyltransferase [Oscillospiraceae bacterium]|nr:acyltransferase [Oscillospiraceae bacterium]
MGKTSDMKASRRIYYIDLARFIAIISITLNHAVSRSFDIYGDNLAEFNELPVYMTIIKCVTYVFSRIGVPLFLMISGALMLPRDYTQPEKIKGFVKGNWLNLFITTEIWLVIMFWFLNMTHGSDLRTHGLGRALFSFVENQLFVNQTTFPSMWYMPMILCVYLMIPIISVAVNKIDRKYFILPLAIAVVSGMIVPTFNAGLEAAGSYRSVDFALSITDLFSVYLIPLVMGYFVSQGVLKKLSNIVVITVSATSFILVCAFQFWIYTTGSNYSVRYESLGLLICSVFLFEALRRIKNSTGTHKIVTEISKISFAIYFLHIIIMTVLQKVLYEFPIDNKLIALIILEVGSFIGSIIIIEILKKIPVIKKHLFMIKD